MIPPVLHRHGKLRGPLVRDVSNDTGEKLDRRSRLSLVLVEQLDDGIDRARTRENVKRELEKTIIWVTRSSAVPGA